MSRLVLAVLLLTLASLTVVPAMAQQPHARAGVAVVDSTWNVGACAGQYCDVRDPSSDPLSGPTDPFAHNRLKEASYGVQSRLTTRAIVLEGAEGTRYALVKTDNYLAQDMLLRRVGQLLEDGNSGIGYDQIFHAATHNHSSPYYATPAAGVWVFEDVFDQRMFEFSARAMAQAIEEAAADMVPVRMGATTVTHEIFKGNIVGPQTADDGSPAGYPFDFGDLGLPVVRFDDVSDPANPTPLATWINWGQHPEGLDGYNLITADFLTHLERFVDADTGATMVFSQGDVGSAEGPYDSRPNATVVDDEGTIRAFAHTGHAQLERGARFLADDVLQAFDAIGAGVHADGTPVQVPFSTDFTVDFRDAWIPGPLSHPYPSVSNCRTETTANGHPGVPVAGLPDCGREPDFGYQGQQVIDLLEAEGVPVPDHYDAPAFGAVEENLRLRLQVVRLGDVLIGSCACEAQVDLILNFETRADRVQDNMWLGYEWPCEPVDPSQEGGDWRCWNPEPTDNRDWVVSDDAYQRMRAQVRNDAAGWDADSNAIAAGSESPDVAQIHGNFTHEELAPEHGYGLVVGVGHAGDYNGYTVSYREYMAYDHYRKALTAYGPHTADYMVTRMVRLAREMSDPTYEMPAESHDLLARSDEARQAVTALALGNATGPAYDAWLAALPTDLDAGTVLAEPTSITRFDAATFSWAGGNNAIDNPLARVERRADDGTWQPFAQMDGGVQTILSLPEGVTGVADAYTASQRWDWTASFEAFSAAPSRLGQTPAGTYRFVVEGRSQTVTGPEDYRLESQAFEVAPWGGLTVDAIEVTDETVAVDVSPVAYPRSYTSPIAMIGDDGRERLCRTCTFRPWASTADVASVAVEVTRANGDVDRFDADQDAGGRWVVVGAAVRAGDALTVPAGGLLDANGETNAVAFEG